MCVRGENTNIFYILQVICAKQKTLAQWTHVLCTQYIHTRTKRNNHAFNYIVHILFYNRFSPIYLFNEMHSIKNEKKRKWRQPFNNHKNWYSFVWHLIYTCGVYAASNFCEMSFISLSLSLLMSFINRRLRKMYFGSWRLLHLKRNFKWKFSTTKNEQVNDYERFKNLF